MESSTLPIDSKDNVPTDVTNEMSKGEYISALMSGQIPLVNFETARFMMNSVANHLNHPLNLDGFFYVEAESVHNNVDRELFAPGVFKTLKTEDFRHRVFSKVGLSHNDKTNDLNVDYVANIVEGNQGYSSVRASHGVTQGSWYFEAKVLRLPNNAAVRIGYSQIFNSVYGVCGGDIFSYSWRSKNGTLFHNRRGTHFSEGYDVGDIIGCHIYLPRRNSFTQPYATSKFPPTLVTFKNKLYYEYIFDLKTVTKEAQTLEGSYIQLFKNGVSLGKAFTNLLAGMYFPCISIYEKAKVQVNFGPHLASSPQVSDIRKRGIVPVRNPLLTIAPLDL